MPNIIVIGGGVANAEGWLFDPFKKHLFDQLSEPFKQNLKIHKAKFSNEAGILGAAVLSSSLAPLA